MKKTDSIVLKQETVNDCIALLEAYKDENGEWHVERGRIIARPTFENVDFSEKDEVLSFMRKKLKEVVEQHEYMSDPWNPKN